jgi:2',3'-cyclic-nucleotide 2'-phosphodiesterase (5'-nucleotidase family)
LIIDTDFGVDELVDFANESNFPWLMSNVFDKHTKRPLAEGRVSLTLEWNGHKVMVKTTVVLFCFIIIDLILNN